MKTLVFSPVLALLMPLSAAGAEPTLYDIPLKDIDGKETSLAEHQGKALLLVNVASQCGYTNQYSGLQALHEKMKDQGLVVIGIPSNDFGEQEPGTEAEIKTFCSTRYSVTFPMLAKMKIAGDDKHPLFAALTGEDSPIPGEVGWNFEKLVIGTDGTLVARFDSGTEPDATELAEAIEKALAKP